MCLCRGGRAVPRAPAYGTGSAALEPADALASGIVQMTQKASQQGSLEKCADYKNMSLTWIRFPTHRALISGPCMVVVPMLADLATLKARKGCPRENEQQQR